MDSQEDIRGLEHLISLFRRYNTLNQSPLDVVLLLSSLLPNSIKINQIVWKDQKQEEEKEEDKEFLEEPLLYHTKIVIENQFPFEAIDSSKNKSVEKAATLVVQFLNKCVVQQDWNLLEHMMALSQLGLINPDKYYEYEEEEQEFGSKRKVPAIMDRVDDQDQEKLLDCWVQLIDAFKSVNSSNKNELEILDKIIESRPHLLKITTESPVPPLKMYTTIIELTQSKSGNFIAKSPFGTQDSKWEAAIKLVDFLQNLTKLLNNFKSAYAPAKEPFKLVVGLIHQNSNIIKMVKSGSDLVQHNPKYSTKIEIVNVVTVEESGPDCGDVAALKIVDCLKKLSKIEVKKVKDKSQPENKPFYNDTNTNSSLQKIEDSMNSKPINDGLQKEPKNDSKVDIGPIESKEKKEDILSDQNKIKSDDQTKGIMKKMENLKEGQFKKKLLDAYKTGISQNRSPLDMLDYLKAKGINLEVIQTSKKSHFQTRIKFRGFTGGCFPEFSDNSRKKLDSKRGAAAKLVAYLNSLAKEEDANWDEKNFVNCEVSENKDEDKNQENEEKDSKSAEVLEKSKTKKLHDSCEKNEILEKLIQRFRSLNLLKQSQLEILDMLKSKGEQVEINQEVNSANNFVTKIIIGQMEFTATAAKKADSKREAANKVVQFLKAMSSKQSEKAKKSEDSVSESESDEEQEEEKPEEVATKPIRPIVHKQKARSDSVGSNEEPLWGHYEAKSPFVINQNKRKLPVQANGHRPVSSSVSIQELERRHFGPDRNREGPDDDKIKELIMLIKRFDSVNSKSKGKLQVINDLKDRGQPLKIFRTVNKNEKDNTLIFHVSVNVEGIAYFEQNSPDKKQAEAYCLTKTMRFLKNLSHLVKNFLFFYARTKYPTEIIESLMIKNFEMLIMKEEELEDGTHKISMTVTNIAIYTGQDRNPIRAKEIAMTKVCYLILKLAGIASGSLKVKDYVAQSQWKLDIRRAVPIQKKPVVPQRKQSAESEEEEDSDDESVDETSQKSPTYSQIFKKNLEEPRKIVPTEPVKSHPPTSTKPNQLQRYLELIEHFKSAPAYDPNNIESQWAVLDHLRAQGQQIRIISDIVGSSNTREYILTIDIKEVAIFSAQNKSEMKCKEEALGKAIDFLQSITQLGQNGKSVNSATCENDEKDSNERKDNQILNKSHLEILLEMFKETYSTGKSPSQHMDNLMEQIKLTYPNLSKLIQLNQISMDGQQCITTIQIGGEGFDFGLEVFHGTGLNLVDSKQQASLKFVHFLAQKLELHLERQLDLQALIRDPDLVLDPSVSKMVFDVVREKWIQLVHVNPVSQFKCLAAFVITSITNPSYARVLSIGTGSQSMESQSTLPYNGQVVLDCHAEVIARRSLVRLLYDQIQEVIVNHTNPDLFIEPGSTAFRLKQNLRLHLYLSSTPCTEPSSKFNLFKPCADKIKCWNVLGVQGSLLGAFMEPMYLESVIVSDLTGFDKLPHLLYDGLDKNLLQAMLESVGLDGKYKLNRHKIGYFRLPTGDKGFEPSLLQEYPISHNWYRPTNSAIFSPTELVHSLLGIMVSQDNQPSRLCKQRILERHQELLHKYPALRELNATGAGDLVDSKFAPYYRGLKDQSVNYQKAKKALRDTFAESSLGPWLQAPFHVDLFMI